MSLSAEPSNSSSVLRLLLTFSLACTISLIPAAKVLAVEVLSSSGTSKMVVVPMAEESQQEPEEAGPAEEDSPDQAARPLDEPAYSAPDPSESESEQGSAWYLVGGGAVAAAALALALGGGGGGGGGDTEPAAIPPSSTPSSSSSSSTTTTTPTTTTPTPTPTPAPAPDPVTIPTPEPSTAKPVGVAIAGDTWAGYLDLVNGGRQNVTAVVYQNGDQIQINTSSTLEYGKVFKGRIFSNGHMRLYDLTTGQDWTTHYGPVFPTQIDIYDYVNNFTALDRLFLKR